MKTLVVFNHPYSGSYCSAILESVKQALKESGQSCDLIHLDGKFVTNYGTSVQC